MGTAGIIVFVMDLYLSDDEATAIRWILMRRDAAEFTCRAGLRRMKLTMTDRRLLTGNPKWFLLGFLQLLPNKLHNLHSSSWYSSACTIGTHLHKLFNQFHSVSFASAARLRRLHKLSSILLLLFFVFTTFRLTFFGTHILIYSDIFFSWFPLTCILFCNYYFLYYLSKLLGVKLLSHLNATKKVARL